MERMTEEKKVHLEGAKVYGPQDYEVVDEMKILEEENRNLKERVSELEDVSKDYDLLSKDFITLGEENEKLKAELSRWQQGKYRYFGNDGETDLYECMEEDTLQELKDIGEI